MNWQWKYLWPAFAASIITIFLPKRLLLCTRELFLYIFNTILNSWKAVTILVVLTTLIYIPISNLLPLKLYLISSSLLIIFIVTSQRLRQTQKKVFRENTLFVFGCFSTYENEYLMIDIDAESINNTLKKKCHYFTSKNFVFNKKLLELEFIPIPKFLPLLLGYNGTKKLFNSYIQQNKHISSIYFIRNINDQLVEPFINYQASNFANIELLNDVQIILNKLNKAEGNRKVNDVIEINISIYILIFSQTLLDSFNQKEELSTVQYILDDSKKNLEHLKNQFKVKNIDIPEVANFFNVWQSYLDRYSSTLLIQQKDYRGAIAYLVSSIELNPYYPYFDYETFKENYTKRYSLELSKSFIDDNESIVKNKDIRKKISENILCIDIEFSYEVILRILQDDPTGLLAKYTEEKFENIHSDNSAIKLAKAEVTKYLPDDSEKINEIYSGRIDSVIILLEEILTLDKRFPIIQTKIGALLMNKSIITGDERDIEKAMKTWASGMHFLTQLGFTINN